MSKKAPSPREPIAVVGVSALFPGSTEAGGFWRNILSGRDLLSDVPPSHWLIDDYYDPDPLAPDKTYGKRGGFLPPVPFDPVEFGVPPSTLPSTDTAQLLALIVARQVLEDAAAGQFERLDRERISVILGVASTTELVAHMAGRLQRPVWRKALREGGLPESQVEALCERIAAHYAPWQESTFPGLLGNVVAGRIANRLNLGGTNCVVDAACASSLSALSMAVNELYLGQSDLVVAGGVDTLNDILMYMCFSKTPALSPTGDCRPFSDKADGTMLGEGLAMVALRRLSDAERDGDRIYAVLRGIGASSDGRARSVYAPLPGGQARALRRAYEAAGYSPATVELVEAHGTGTTAGDAAEFEGLRTVFEESGRGDRQWCALGSIKSQIGHTKAAAGAAGLFKVIMALHHKVLPPTIKVEQPNPRLELPGSPFYLNTEARPWISAGPGPRRASVSAFGFGGSNFHAAFEEYTGPARAFRLRACPTELVPLAGQDPAALAARCEQVRESLSAGASLAQVARACQEAFTPGQPARLAIVASSEEDLQRKLVRAAERVAGPASLDPSGIYHGVGEPAGPVAFLFPGQGSQYLGMGADLAMTFDAAREAWELASATLGSGPERLHEVVFARPVFRQEEREALEARLRETRWAQPAIGAASLAQLALLRAIGVSPLCAAGHSFGELTALHAAGVLDAAGLLRVARKRGELMAEAAALPGAMSAVTGPVEDLLALLARWDHDVVVANHNAPRQVVLSGTVAELERVEQRLTESGVRWRRLPVATAFHSPIVAGSSAPLLAFLKEVPFGRPELAVFANAEAAPYPEEADRMREWLAGQLARPVRFVEQVEAMYRLGARVFVEVGPASVLTGLVGQCLEGRSHVAVSLDRKGQHGVTGLWHALAQLVAAGVPLDLGPLWSGYAPVRPVRPRSAHAILISGANYGKPYPPPGGAAALPGPNPEPPMETPVALSAATWQDSDTDQAEQSSEADATWQSGEDAEINEEEPMMTRDYRDWLLAFQESQRQTADAHSAYQRAMAETHLAYLRTTERFTSGLTSLFTGQPAPEPPAAAPPAALVPPQSPRSNGHNGHLVGYAGPVAGPAAASNGHANGHAAKGRSAEAPQRQAPPPAPPQHQAPPPAPPQHQAPPPEAAQRQLPPPLPAGAGPAPPSPGVPAAQDLKALMLQVVAEKTGYPIEILEMDMELEAGLGIDSIKRVEILSAMQERAPGLPAVRPSEMASLRTIGEIVAYMERALGGATAPAKEEPRPFDEAPLGRYAVQVVRTPAAGFARSGLLGGLIAITRDERGIAEALRHHLVSRGVTAEVVETVPAEAAGVIFLGGLRQVATQEEALAVCREAFRVARGLAGRLSAGPGLFVTAMDTGGDLGLGGGPRPWLGGLCGLVKTAALEWPRASVAAIDLEQGDRSPEELARALGDELLSGGPEVEVGLRAGGERVTLAVRPAPVPAGGAPVFDERSVVVVSGGARGVTAAAVVALARRVRPRLVLFGRTPLAEEPAACHGHADDACLKQALLGEARRSGRAVTPKELGRQAQEILAAREIRATLRAVREAGAQVRYFALDVQDADQVDAVLDEVRREWGPITGLIHGAGVLADSSIADKVEEQLDRVLSPKVAGLASLLSATAADPLRAICLFSSVAARFGNPGQCDYAMANEILNKVAWAEARRRGAACLVRSIDWGPWAGGMVTPSLSAHFRERGVPLIPLQEGARLLAEELTDGPRRSDVEVVIGAGQGLVRRAGEAALLVRVDPAAYPFLTSHCVKDVPVVPVVLVMEWFLRAAAALSPDDPPRALRDLKVLRGIQLRRFQEEGHWFTVHCRQVPGAVACELRGSDGALHYTAMAEAAPEGPAHATPPALSGPWPFARETIYGDLLFHGPAFHAIESLEGAGEQGGVATLIGLRALGWPAAAFRTDPAALDGALQVIRLWGFYRTGQPCLPTGVGRLVWFGDGPADGPLRCEVRCHTAGAYRTLSDIRLVGADGRLWAEVQGVEAHFQVETTTES